MSGTVPVMLRKSDMMTTMGFMTLAGVRSMSAEVIKRRLSQSTIQSVMIYLTREGDKINYST